MSSLGGHTLCFSVVPINDMSMMAMIPLTLSVRKRLDGPPFPSNSGDVGLHKTGGVSTDEYISRRFVCSYIHNVWIHMIIGQMVSYVD